MTKIPASRYIVIVTFNYGLGYWADNMFHRTYF